MKFHVGLIMSFLICTSFHFLCTGNKNESDLLRDSLEAVERSKADSVVYITNPNGLVAITTLEEYKYLKSHGYPFAPPTPFYFQAALSPVKMNIRDSTDKLVKTYKFDKLQPGEYNLQWWAFEKDLPWGKYSYELVLSREVQVIK